MSKPETRTVVTVTSLNTEQISAILHGLLKHFGYDLVVYTQPGEEIETSHGRSYWSEGKKTYKLEKSEEN